MNQISEFFCKLFGIVITTTTTPTITTPTTTHIASKNYKFDKHEA